VIEEEKVIPKHMLMKVLNRRRRLVALERAGGPVNLRASERLLLDKALDEFCAWAEEHAPELFYSEKEI